MTSYVLRRLQCSLRQGKQIYELGLVPVRCGSRALCGFVLCVCLCREQPHLAPVSYGRPAAVHRQSENALGRLKVTVAQVCMCLHCNCVGFCSPHPKIHIMYIHDTIVNHNSLGCEQPVS